MQKKYKIIIVVFLAVFMLRICLSNDKKNVKPLIKKTTDCTQVTVAPLPQLSAKINPGVFGINIGFAFHRELDKDSGFVQLLRAAHPNSLRFPGGTVANYYHPDLPVYGYKMGEFIPSLYPLYNRQKDRSENILYNYIRLCKSVNAGAVYCANVLNGTTQEIIFVIRELRKNNIPVLGVELGNEFNLMAYRKEFPEASVYVKKIKETALTLRKEFPDLKIVVIGGDGFPKTEKNVKSNFMRAWNEVMSKEIFFDAYTTHIYETCAECDKDEYFDNVYTKNLTTLAPANTKHLYNTGVNLVEIYGKERKLWLTEWNLGNLEYLENTFTQGAYVYENFLTLIDLNTKFDNYFEVTNLHSIDGLISVQNGKQKAIKSIGDNHASTQYFAFQFLASTLTNQTHRAAEKLITSDKNLLKDFVCLTFVNPETHKTYVHFVNRSGKKVQLNLDVPENKSLEIHAIESDFPYATAGKTNYEKKYPDKLTPVALVEKAVKKENIILAPYAYGYVSYSN